MGLGPSKTKIKQILQKSCNGERIINGQDCIPFHYIQNTNTNTHAQVSTSFQSTQVDISVSNISDSSLAEVTFTPVKDSGKFPFCTVGTLIVKFPKSSETFMSTCVMINENVALTLASNLYNRNYGGDAKEIKTTFSKEVIQPTHVKLMDGFKTNPKDDNNFGLIFFSTKICSDHLGVIVENITDPNSLFTCIMSLGPSKKEIAEAPVQDNGSVFVTKEEGFIPSDLQTCLCPVESILLKEETEEKLICAQGAPIFSENINQEKNIFALLNQDYRVQKIPKEALLFMIDGVNGAKSIIKRGDQKIEESRIIQLDLSRNDFGPLDIKYLSEFDLRNLVILDLNSNSIKPQGAYFLSQGKYPNLRTLNLNFNEIGDEGTAHISNANFSVLEQLFLFHNNISSNGVKSLCNANFISTLIILSLSENPQITDEGCKYIRDQKAWNCLTILNLNRTGLTNNAIEILSKCVMPNLRKIHLVGNSITKTKNDSEIVSWSNNGRLIIELDKKKKKK